MGTVVPSLVVDEVSAPCGIATEYDQMCIRDSHYSRFVARRNGNG